MLHITTCSNRTSYCDIARIIVYYAYFGLAQPPNPLRFVQQFFRHNVNGRPSITTLCQDTAVEVDEYVEDFSDDEDLTSSEVATTEALSVKRYLR